MLNQEQIKGKWIEIKGGVRNLWGKVTDDELEATKGNIQSVSGIVEKKYGETKESITKKLDDLMKSFDNETDKSLKINDGESSYQRNPTGIRTSAESEFESEAEEFKTRSPERSTFELSQGGAINAKQGIAGNQDNQPYPGGSGASFSAGAGTHEPKKSNLYDVDGVTFNPEEDNNEYDGEEIFDNGKKEDPTYNPKKPGSLSEDRIARH
ncbi:MAG: CsbD family protein [Bdellovibrionales bacterium]|nr:CsbD family protein [Bdellovibrionales bacterium]